MLKPNQDSKRIIDRVHPEYARNVLRYDWLQDSYDADHYYRERTYGSDDRGFPIHNLLRHKREYPTDSRGQTLIYSPGGYGQDAAARAGDDDFQLRKARTPIPTFTSEAIDTHLAKVYAAEINRDGPGSLKAFWDDVDGEGTSIDEWMRTVVAVYLRVFGVLDICCDHPAVPEGEKIRSKADELRLKLNSCVASVILPQNMQWWKLDAKGRYLECLVREPQEGELAYFRHWTASEWTLYDDDGKVIRTQPHNFGVVPIVRLFNRRDPRGKNLGKSWAEPIAIMQREYYNRDSELILSDTLQAHPVLQMPEEFLNGGSEVSIGPSFILPMKKNNSGSTVSYQGAEFLSPAKDAAESIRLNKQDIRDQADRYACLTKPAGSNGTTGSTVSQSGVSKQIDATTGNDLLTKLAVILGRAEWQIANLALIVLGNGKPTPQDIESIKVTYPGSFDLFSADEIAKSIANLQDMLSSAGQCPETEKAAIKRYVGEWLQGLEDDEYERINDEIDEFIDGKSEIKKQQNEAGIDPKTGMPIIPPEVQPTDPAQAKSPKPKAATKSPKAAEPPK